MNFWLRPCSTHYEDMKDDTKCIVLSVYRWSHNISWYVTWEAEVRHHPVAVYGSGRTFLFYCNSNLAVGDGAVKFSLTIA